MMLKHISGKFKSIKFTSLLSLWGVAFFSLLAVSILSYIFARNQINREITAKMNFNMTGVINEIDVILTKHSRLSSTLARVVEATGTSFSRAQYIEILNRFVKLNDDTLGVGLWYEPYKYNPGIKYFGPYTYKSEGKIVQTDEYETEKYNYPSWEWYTIGKNTKKDVRWTNPFFDTAQKIVMVTCTGPFYDRNGNFLGVTTSDMDIKTIQQIIKNLKVGNTGYAYLLDSSGLIIAHPVTELMGQKKIDRPWQ